MGPRIGCLLMVALMSMAQPSPAAPAVMLVDTSAVMPEARIEGAKVLEGLHADLAAALSKRLGRAVDLRAVPRKRIAQELQAGKQADLVCDYQPEWLPGPFSWSEAFIPNQLVLITARGERAPTGLHDVAGVRLGTVLGFAYPELETALGPGFLRDDAPDSETNLRKFELGRSRHVVVGRRLLEYQQRTGRFRTPIQPPLHVAAILGRCALSPRSVIAMSELNAAIRALVAEGELTQILARYR